MRIEPHRQRGTTLIELILYLAISTGVMLGIGMTTMAVLEQREKARAMNEARYGAAIIMDRFRRDVSEASRIDVTLLTEGSSTTLRIHSSDATLDKITYDIVGGLLLRSVASGTPQRTHPEGTSVRDARFIVISPDGAPQTAIMRGLIVVGEESASAIYKANAPIDATVTIRAQQP